jgi:integrase
MFSAVPTIGEYKADLEAAGIPYMLDGQQVDFHSLRKTFCTLLSKAGVLPRVAMELMQHTDIRLTMVDYTDPRILDTAAAVESLPSTAAKQPKAGAGTGN